MTRWVQSQPTIDMCGAHARALWQLHAWTCFGQTIDIRVQWRATDKQCNMGGALSPPTPCKMYMCRHYMHYLALIYA